MKLKCRICQFEWFFEEEPYREQKILSIKMLPDASAKVFRFTSRFCIANRLIVCLSCGISLNVIIIPMKQLSLQPNKNLHGFIIYNLEC